MIITPKNKNLCLFYYSRGKWIGPSEGEFYSEDDIVGDYGEDKDNFEQAKIKALKAWRRCLHKKVKFGILLYKLEK